MCFISVRVIQGTAAATCCAALCPTVARARILDIQQAAASLLEYNKYRARAYPAGSCAA